jgi:hypothetical protein
MGLARLPQADKDIGRQECEPRRYTYCLGNTDQLLIGQRRRGLLPFRMVDPLGQPDGSEDARESVVTQSHPNFIPTIRFSRVAVSIPVGLPLTTKRQVRGRIRGTQDHSGSPRRRPGSGS